MEGFGSGDEKKVILIPNRPAAISEKPPFMFYPLDLDGENAKIKLSRCNI